jgi:hypothetical protein
MNILTVRDASGRVVRETPIDSSTTIQYALGDGLSYSIMAPPGYKLNGHRIDCRCETCRPDIWRLP